VKYLNCKLYYQQLHLKYLCNLARYWLQAPWWWHDSVETCRSVIFCEIIVHLLVIVRNLENKKTGSSLVFCAAKPHSVVEMPASLCEIRPTLRHFFVGQQNWSFYLPPQKPEISDNTLKISHIFRPPVAFRYFVVRCLKLTCLTQ
jgi:hypothetical protein